MSQLAKGSPRVSARNRSTKDQTNEHIASAPMVDTPNKPFAKDPMAPSGGPESHQLAKGSPRVSARNRNTKDQTNEHISPAPTTETPNKQFAKDLIPNPGGPGSHRTPDPTPKVNGIGPPPTPHHTPPSLPSPVTNIHPMHMHVYTYVSIKHIKQIKTIQTINHTLGDVLVLQAWTF